MNTFSFRAGSQNPSIAGRLRVSAAAALIPGLKLALALAFTLFAADVPAAFAQSAGAAGRARQAHSGSRGHEPDRARTAYVLLLRRQEPVGATLGALHERCDAGDRRQWHLYRQATRARVHADGVRAGWREGGLTRESHAVPVDSRHLAGWQDRVDSIARVCDEARRVGPAAVRKRVPERKRRVGGQQ